MVTQWYNNGTTVVKRWYNSGTIIEYSYLCDSLLMLSHEIQAGVGEEDEFF